MLSALWTLLLFTCSFSSAEFGITPNLTKSNREQVLKVLGLGVSTKNISIPGGLGTQQGLEISLSNQFINTEKISHFLTDEEWQNTLYYPKISIGKGLNEHTDLFIHFTPYTATLGLTEFGGSVRVRLFQQTDSPFSISAILNMGSVNFNNQITARGLSGDVSFGMRWDRISIFSSIGMAQSRGTFYGGTQGITDSLLNETESVSSMHFSVGTLARYKIYFLSAALDHYTQPVYSLKLGFYF